MSRNVIRWLAWASLLAVFAFTDLSIGYRPHTIVSPNADRFAALATVAALFSLAYPRRILLISAFLAAAIVSFELGQLLLANRHGTLRDIVVKLAGASVGVFFAVLAERFVTPAIRGR